MVPIFAMLGFGALNGVLAGSVTAVTPLEAEGLLRNDFAVLVDVREADETRSGMAARAVAMPLSKVEANSTEWQAFVKGLSPKKQVIFYCRSGGRAGHVAKILGALRPELKVANMGGFDDWVAAKLPVKK